MSTSTSFHNSTSGDIHFVGETRHATDFYSEGFIICIGWAMIGLGRVALQIIVFDSSNNICRGLLSLVQRFRETITDYRDGEGSLFEIFQNLFFESAICFVYGAHTGVGLGAILYMDRFRGLTEIRCDPDSGGSCTRSLPYDG